MEHFAHAGVEHATAAEEAAHVTGLHPAILVGMLSFGALVLVIAAIYALKKFSVITIPIDKNKES